MTAISGKQQESWGSSASRIRPGGGLGKTEIYYKTIASGPRAGEVEVYRYSKVGRASSSSVKIGSIPPGGRFNVESKANGDPVATSAEILHYAENDNLKKARINATKVAQKEWNGYSQPPPNQSINGPWRPVGDENVDTNTATKGPAGSDYTLPTPQESAVQKALKLAGPDVKVPNNSLQKGEVVVYPLAMRHRIPQSGGLQDHIKISQMQYQPKGVGSGFGQGFLSGVAPRKDRIPLSSVILPIPGGIADNNSTAWGDKSMDPVGQAFASIAMSSIFKGLEAGGAKAKDILKEATSGSEEVKAALGSAIAAKATGMGEQVLQRQSGAIINPNMELLFNGPQLRQFNFSWKLAPRSRDEAVAVIKILRFFKQGMAPIREAPNLFLKSPNTWQLKYHHSAGDHKYLNKFKECALLNCGVQYTPDGNYATFEDGVMTAYQLTLAFQELDPVYSDDYKEVPSNEIGF